MNESKNIKIVEKGIIETNSSSSHSLTLGSSNFIKPEDKDWDVNIKDRILYIPTCDSFGWEFFKFNSIQRKLQYLSGLFFYEGDISISAQKDIKKLKSLLCKVFDIDDVIFEWVEEYKKEYLLDEIKDSKFDPCYTDFSPITVDHESRYLRDEIIESESTLRSFLFSRDSWVFGGSDSSDAPNGFYKEEKQKYLNSTASIDFPGLGRIDFRIYYPGDVSKYISSNLNDIRALRDYGGDSNILKYFIYDKEQKIVYPINWIEEKKIDDMDLEKYMEYKAIISYKGDYYCLYVQSRNDDKILMPDSNELMRWEKAVNAIFQPTERVRNYKSTFKEISDKFVAVLDSGFVRENIDYKLFKIEIKQDELDYIK